MDRIAALERLSQAAQAAQVRELAALKALRVAEDAQIGLSGEHGRPVGAGRGAKALGVATMTARTRVENAATAVESHPRLLELVGTGRVSMAGLNRVIETTRVLEPAQQRRVDELVCAEARRRKMTPGELAKAADRRVLEIDPDAAAKRAARARATRDVRLSDPWQGTATVWASLRAEEALAIYTRIDRTSRGMRAAGDPRPLNTLRADLVCELLLGKAAVTPTGSRPTSRPSSPPTSRPRPAEPAEDTSAVPDWRSTNGLEPWVASTPPPAAAVTDRRPGARAGAAGTPTPTDLPADQLAPDPDADADPELSRAGHRRRRRVPVDVEVQVVVSLATWLGLDREPGLLRGYGAIDADTLDDIITTAQTTGATTSLRRLFCDPTDGRLVQMDSTARRFTGTLRQFTTWRDHTDRLTGDTIADIDHIRDHHHARTHRRAQRPRPVPAQPHPQRPPPRPHQSPHRTGPGATASTTTGTTPPTSTGPCPTTPPTPAGHHPPSAPAPTPPTTPSTPNGSPGSATCRTSRRHHTPTTRSTPSPPSSPDSATPADSKTCSHCGE